MKFLSYFLCLLGATAVICFEPYDVLGVSRSAGPDEIRKTYKKLAREFHPDKNRSPDAGDKFTEINKAYEILGDDKKKEKYDRFGRVDDSPQQGGGQGRPGQFYRTPFGDFHFPGGGFNQGSDYMTNSITDRYLQNHILPESHTKPYFFFATTDFCFNCMRVHPIWKLFTKDLESLDVNFGMVDVDYEPKVVRRLKVPRIPSIGAVFHGRSILFEAEEYSVKNLRDFMRRLLPDDLIVQVNSENIDSYLSGYQDNRVRVIFFGTHGLPTMRFLIPVYQVRKHVLATYVDVNSHHSAALLDRYDVGGNTETLIVIKEDSENPVYAESKKQFSTSDILSILKSNRYLKLPRLNRPEMYEELCPRNTDNYNKYCVILTFDSKLFHTEEVNMFRDYISQKVIPSNINLMYALTDVQKPLMDAWRRPSESYKIVIVARREAHEADLTWIDWCTDRCTRVLDMAIMRLANNGYDFSRRNFRRYEIKDEDAGGLFYRILKRLRDWWDYATYTYFDGDSTLTVVSILSTTVCVLIMGFVFNLINNQSAERRAEQNAAKRPSSAANRANEIYRFAKDSDKFVIYDVRSHNYSKLIKEAPSGYRLILLFVDAESKQRLVRRFAELMMPFNRTPYFLFGFVYIDKYISWYQRIISQTLGGRGDYRRISAQHCIGTVLAVNGYRKYYNIYHPKTVNLSHRQGGDGAFIGLDDSESSDSEAEDLNGHAVNGHATNGNSQPLDGDAMLSQGRLLDGLGHWIDRLFDGSLPKCKIDYWPIFPVDASEPSGADADGTETENKKDQ